MGKLASRLNNVKIFILYLLKNIGVPVDYVTLGEMIMRTDYVLYLDFAEAFPELHEKDLIAEDGKNDRGEPLYTVTQKGRLVAEELKSDLFRSILDKSLACALQYLDFKARGVVAECSSRRLPDTSYAVTVTLREGDKILLTATLNTDSAYHAEQMTEHFYENPEQTYKGLTALLTGQVDYLWNKQGENNG